MSNDDRSAAPERRNEPDERVASLLRRHPPAAPEPSDAFRATLREHFVRSAARQAAADERTATGGRTITGDRASTSDRRRLWPAWGGGLGSWPKAPALGLSLALVLLAGFGLTRLLPDAAAPGGASELAGRELIERNAQAWIGVRDVKGRFVDAQGRRYEEWVRFDGSQPPYYRRLVDGPAIVDGVDEQWNISDGRRVWLVDGADGRIVEEAAVGGGDAVLLSTPTDLQCAYLELPAELDVPTGPVPETLLDGRRVYRLETTVGQQARVYYLDAEDYLVRRIEDADGARLWARDTMSVNSGIPRSDFVPGSTDRLDL